MSKRRSLDKRLTSSPIIVWTLCILASLVIRLVYLTNRISKQYAPGTHEFESGKRSAIFCFWHGRMLAQPFINPPVPMYVLISRSRDGVLISTLMRCFRICTVSGSRSRGAAAALRAMLQLTEKNYNIAITPDGPRGPFQQAVNGAAYLASKSGYPILPITYSASRSKRLRSWDRFMLFKPFGRIQFIVGDPIHVPADADDATIEQTTVQLQEVLTRITHEADTICGVAA
jgi:lysophospholipid acyltransferase (LPLAT)-like uncharacterized protein